jgi:hypothetical protein
VFLLSSYSQQEFFRSNHQNTLQDLVSKLLLRGNDLYFV